MATRSPLAGVGYVLHNGGAAVADGVFLAVPPSFTYHRINIKGTSGVTAGGVRPASKNNPLDAEDPNYLTSEITVVADGEVDYTFTGTFGSIGCPITTEIADGTVTVTYYGRP